MDKILSVEEMLATEDIEYRNIPAWGGIVRIGSLSSDEVVDWLEVRNADKDDPRRREAGAMLIVNSLVNEKNERIGRPQHVAAFRKKSHAMTEKILREIVKMNGLGGKEIADRKNDSGEAPSAASPSS